MMRVNVRLQGLERAIRNIQDFEVEKKEEIKNVVKETAFKIQANAKQRTPVDTGHLKRNIEVDISQDELSADIGTNVEYGKYVEFGTATQKSQPFLFPAYEEEKDEYISNLERVLGDTR